MILVILLIVLAWVFCGILAATIVGYIDSERGNMYAEVERISSSDNAVPMFLVFCLFGPISLSFMLVFAIWVNIPPIEIANVLYYIPLKIAELIDCLFIKPGGDNEHQ